MILQTTVPMKCAGGTVLYDDDEIDIADALDQFERLPITIGDMRGNQSCTTTMSKSEAKQIVDHLTRVFALEKKG